MPTEAAADRLQGLRTSTAYPHPTRDIRLVETHISWILLTGDYAYKLKKPVDLGFLDFSTLEKRRYFCERELELNRRTAPELYLDVVEIREGPDGATLVGDGPVVDYAVRMRQFDPASELDHELDAGRLGPEDMRELAREIADLHGSAPRADRSDPWGEPERVIGPPRDNFDVLRSAHDDEAWRDRVAALESWTERRFQSLRKRIAGRKEDGFVRECHGDLHLSNLVRLDEGFRAFDCIEFSDALRWIDVISDVAFLVMDLQVRDRDDLAFAFLGEYLEASGDYPGVRLLDFHLCYRTLVRAKVAALRLRDPLSDAERREVEQRLDRHVNLAERFTRERPVGIVMMRGLSGSGKSWLGARLTTPLEGLRIRSDVERKRLQGFAPLESTGSTTGAGIYTPDVTEQTYRRLAELAGAVVAGGYTAIVDAAHLHREQREIITQTAARAGVPVVLVDCDAPTEVLEERIRARSAAGADPSEANVEVLRAQRGAQKPLSSAERENTIRVDTTQTIEIEALARDIRRRFGA